MSRPKPGAGSTGIRPKPGAGSTGSRPKPGAGSTGNTAQKGFPDTFQKRILIIYGTIFGAGLIYAFLILNTPFRIPCLFREVTGLQCPGCGTSRMALALIRLDIPAAFAYNPVAFFSFPAWFFISIGAFAGRPKALRDPKKLLGILYINIAVYMIFAVLRNLPFQG